MGPSGYPIPSGKGWPPVGSESYVVVRQLTLRSVDSECAGRVIEPPNNFYVGADALIGAEGNIDTSKGY